MSEGSKKVLVVEDDTVIRKLIVMIAKDAGFVTSEATNGFGAISLLETGDYGLIILDLMLPGLSGYDLLERLSHDDCAHCIVVVTAASDDDLDRIARAKVYDVVRKPFDVDHLKTVITEALDRNPTAGPRLHVKPTESSEKNLSPPLLNNLERPAKSEDELPASDDEVPSRE